MKPSPTLLLYNSAWVWALGRGAPTTLGMLLRASRYYFRQDTHWLMLLHIHERMDLLMPAEWHASQGELEPRVRMIPSLVIVVLGHVPARHVFV